FESLRPDASTTKCEVAELVPRLPLKQEVRVRSLASQPFDASAVVGSLKVPTSACCEGGGSFLTQRLRVRVPSPRLGRSSIGRALGTITSSARVLRPTFRPGQLRRTGVLRLVKSRKASP